MKKLKFALIGAGGIANNAHAPAYEKMDNVEIVAVCDIIEERAKKMADRLGAPMYCTDYKKIFELDGLDAVDICTPNYLHSVIAVDALERGINVFCEKPDAVSVAEAEEVKSFGVIKALFELFCEKPELIPEGIRHTSRSDDNMIVVRDYIAGMTDRFAIALYCKHFVPDSWNGK